MSNVSEGINLQLNLYLLVIRCIFITFFYLSNVFIKLKNCCRDFLFFWEKHVSEKIEIKKKITATLLKGIFMVERKS